MTSMHGAQDEESKTEMVQISCEERRYRDVLVRKCESLSWWMLEEAGP